MSSNQVQGLSADAVDEEAVAQYLQQNSDFFERHPQLLARLRLQHPRNGATVSLIERQVEVLREKYQAQEQKLAEFVRVARANNVLADKIHRFTCRLLRTTTTAEALTQIETSLREDFDTFHAVLVLAEPQAAFATAAGASGTATLAATAAATSTVTAPAPAAVTVGDGNVTLGTVSVAEMALGPRFLRRISPQDGVYRSFEGLFATCKPRCGQVRDSQREFLFGSEAASIGSVALVPLGGQPPLGLLAMGSVDHERFHPGMSTEFLLRIGELVTQALSRG
jgi:uncharacterized protein